MAKQTFIDFKLKKMEESMLIRNSRGAKQEKKNLNWAPMVRDPAASNIKYKDIKIPENVLSSLSRDVVMKLRVQRLQDKCDALRKTADETKDDT